LSDLPLIRLVMAIGEADFAQSAVAYLNTRLAVDHISFFVLDHELRPHFLDAASKAATPTARLAGRLYERSMFYLHDPAHQGVSKRRGEQDVMLFRQSADDIRDPAYRDRLYRHFNLLERLSLVRVVDGRWITFNVYRDNNSGAFAAKEIDLLSGLAALLVACTAKHIALTRRESPGDTGPKSRQFLESLLQSIEVRLTLRERQVCALALMGLTVDHIATTLQVQQSTVATLRKRAYRKLGISKLNGLFALCIAKISGLHEQA
jgi:DNA-binding CsgD family transcriptional regulator